MPPAPTPKRELESRQSWRAKERPPELEASGDVPVPPECVKGEGLAEWKRLAAILGPKGALGGDLDRTSLAHLCMAWDEFLALDAKAAGMEVGSREWRCVLSSRNDAFVRWNDLAKRFGLTPADRPRVKLSPNPDGGNKGKARFFKGGPVVGKIGA